jgi:DNA-binding IclR family transcriptional regulator
LINYLPDAEIDNLFRAHGLPKHNERTVCSLEALKSELAEARRQGFAVDNEEHEIGVRCIASPIFNHLGGVVASICIFGPVSRLSALETPALGLEVLNMAREITGSLNGLPPDLQCALLRSDSEKSPGLEQ